MTTIIQPSPSAIHSFPAEILIQIFKETAVLDAFDKHNPPSSLLTCSQVDRRWNVIANTPSLYTEIVVPFQALRQRGYDAVKWARSFLERSACHLINIDIQIRGEIYTEIYYFYALLRSLIPHVSRIRSFAVTIFDELTIDISLFFHPFKYIDAPALEEITIHHTKKADSPELRVSMRNESAELDQIFWSSPKLRKTRFLGAAAQRPLKGLTYIEMRNVVLDERAFRNIAASCPDLRELTLRQLHIPSPHELGSDEPVPMPSLRSLSLGFDYGTSEDLVDRRHRYVLTQIEAPFLEFLELDASELLVGISNVLPRPSSLSRLRTIKLQNLDDRLFFENEYMKELRTCSIESVILVNTQPDALGLDSSVSKREWASLKCLSLDTGDPKDLIWLCQVIVARPVIQTVYLSHRALENLRENILMIHFNENLTWMGIGTQYGLLDSDDGGMYDKAEEWISRRCLLKVLD
ncbi:hypothetical protein L218DRAFT_241339 [Marasmius fiardii PR-910]|nr:hypothetical protein L218DRAFT_241339 [Marasmius fiardii PR-910]